MKKFLKLSNLPAAVALLGLASLIVHQLLYLVGVDRLGLPIPGYPLNYVLLILALAALVLIRAAVSPLTGTGDYPVNFPPSSRSALGNLVMAGCILGTVLFQPCATAGMLSQVWRWMGLAAALCLMWLGLARYGGKKPAFGLYLPVCLFLAIHLVSHYRTWSGTAQVRSYLFPLLGGMTALFFTYYHMAFAIGFPRRRMLLAMGLATLYLGVTGLLDTRYVMLTLGAVTWVVCDLCAWKVPPEEKKEPPKEEAEA